MLLICLAGSLVGTGCKDSCYCIFRTMDTFQQRPMDEADILWVVDDSISMETGQTTAAVAEDTAGLLAKLEGWGVDFHAGVVTTDFDADNPNAARFVGPVITNTTADYETVFQAQLQVGTDGSDQESGLRVASAALTPPLSMTTNVDFLRPDASLAIIVVSDEDDCSGELGDRSTGEECYRQVSRLTPVPDLVAELRRIKEGLAGPLTFSGIIGPDDPQLCPDAIPGERYADAIEMIGGVRASICEEDATAVRDSLAGVAAGLRSVFPLSHLPDPDTIDVSVTDADGQEVRASEAPVSGWAYVVPTDGTDGNIVFSATAVPPWGSTILVAYVCAEGC